MHGKGSLLNKMPGDRWQQLANLRALYAWMWAHPGKQLLFMGAELAQEREWNHDGELDWWILDHWADHRRIQGLVRDLNRVYRSQPAMWEEDFWPEGFEWIDADDSDQSVMSFVRRRAGGGFDGAVVCVANLTPVPRQGYRVGLPAPGLWLELVNTDAVRVGRERYRESRSRPHGRSVLARAALVGGHDPASFVSAMAGAATDKDCLKFRAS